MGMPLEVLKEAMLGQVLGSLRQLGCHQRAREGTECGRGMPHSAMQRSEVWHPQTRQRDLGKRVPSTESKKQQDVQ